MEEFSNDPLGEKQKLKNIENLNGSLRGEVYENKLNIERAKIFCQDIGLNAEEKKFGRQNELAQDKRFTRLFQS